MFIHAQINFIQNDVYFSHLYFSTNLTVRFTKKHTNNFPTHNPL